MVEFNDREISQEEANVLLFKACNDKDLVKVKFAVEKLGADINCYHPNIGARPIVYACKGEKCEPIVEYLLDKNVEVNFKHGDKGRIDDSKQYFLYYAASNAQLSDSLIYVLIKKVNSELKKSESISDYLNYVPTTKVSEAIHISIADRIKYDRPSLYKHLVNEEIIKNNRR